MLTAERLAARFPAYRLVNGLGRAQWTRRGDVRAAGVALLVFFAVSSALVRHQNLGAAAVVVLGLLGTAPLLAARRRPTLALGLPMASGAAFIVAGRLAWPITAIAAWLLTLALCPLRLPPRRAIAALLLTEAAVAAAVFVPDSINVTPWDATIAEGLAAAIAWWAGENVRLRRRQRVERADVALRLQSFAERDAVARERARIARELHDVVAHHVSTIAVRAATLPYEVGDLPPPARAAIAEIAAGARAALADLRAVLGVLRAPADEADGAPQPRLADLPALIARVQSADPGTRILLTVDGPQRPIADGVHVCGYRIIQEALTNAVRHAPGSKVQVEVWYGADELTVAVRDDGASGVLPSDGGGGYGLIGMRERVAMLGGTLKAGPRPGGGFEVVAVLPCPRPATGAES
jgi:signal transduction histidine kinase